MHINIEHFHDIQKIHIRLKINRNDYDFVFIVGLSKQIEKKELYLYEQWKYLRFRITFIEIIHGCQ